MPRIQPRVGINKKTGKLKKGYKYTGEKNKNGLAKIVKTKKMIQPPGRQKGGVRVTALSGDKQKENILARCPTLYKAFNSDEFEFSGTRQITPPALPDDVGSIRVTLRYNGPLQGTTLIPGWEIHYDVVGTHPLANRNEWNMRNQQRRAPPRILTTS